MSDQANPPVEFAGATEGPPSKRPCTIDTPPIANTPDNGSDFYDTPLNAGTPVTAATTEDIPATEPSVSTTSMPMIPGLGLVNGPNDQPSDPAQPTLAAETKQESDNVAGEATKTAENDTPMQDGENESAINSEPVNRAQSEAMEVDQKPEPTTTTTENATEVPQGQPEIALEDEEGEHPEWEVDSSPYESSSDSSSSSDSDDSDDEDYPILSPEEQARILMLAEGGSDDEGDKGKSGAQIRSTNEVAEEVLPIPEITITPEMKIVYLGKVQAAIDNAVLVEANTSGEYQVLESGSLLCSEDRKTLGVVSETLGRVEHPLYTLMYATGEEVKEKGLVKDMPVYYVETHSTFVFTQPLKGLKGSDASNFHDEEIAEEEMEFSDDEAEAEYRKKQKQKRQERKDAKDGGKSKRGQPGPSKLSHSELNYDEEGPEGYTPLARPKNLHEMMGTREAPMEGGERGPSFRGGRGRGRGTDRGRGGRGRGSGGRGGYGDRDQDRRPAHQQGSDSQYAQGHSAPQPQQPAPYGMPTYPQQQPVYGMPQPFPGYQPYPQQYAPQQQSQTPQGGAPSPFPFQFPFQPGFPQQNPFQTIPQGAHINPLFLAALQQQQQQQQQQYQQPQQQYQQPQQPAQGQQPNPSMNFEQVKAQLDLLRNLNNGNQGPPPS
ncbi:hypothetical protein N7456_007580 [Penicillium angulare]|uniref:H/ACA ribonucleoprotein complex non-core subunit NAF1 n=1 Tax=Penicillium angulare TaxID=116970 RepID=A0A9W9FB99_9EURO|nr:hypothetical protein N7456_007580 [Penicillium angulare]